ncbi:MAG: hypothetical protein HWD61_03080 [Parachlamydiaceae bacterium]|nr:MAG: hypothetical protein HWD61_03080 [Parachlamydiaceae bacterium]
MSGLDYLLENFHLCGSQCFNDLGQILGCITYQDDTSQQVLYNNGELVSLSSITEKFGVKNASFKALNNNATIIGTGNIWNENHAIILQPINY